MAAILRLRRGTSTPTLLESELFFNTTSETLVVGESTGNHTLVKIGENTGSISFSGDVSARNLSLSGNAVIAGNITLGGDIYLGDGDNTTDKINVNASLSGSLVPDTDGVYDLGSTSFRYNNLHVVSASIENLTVGGSGILSSSQQITDYNTFLEIGGMDVVSGSSQITAADTFEFNQSVKTRLNTETVISGSSQVDITQTDGYTTFSSSIATTDEGQNDRLDNIENFTASLDVTFEEIASSTHTLVSGSSQIDVNTTQNFQTFSSSVDTRLDEVESTSSINETKITELFSTSSDHESRVDELEVTGSEHETRIDSLETFSSSLDATFVTETELNLATSSLSASLTETDDDFESRITEIETTFSSSVDSRLDAQEAFSESLDNTYEEKASGTHTLFSGSSQVNADTITNFDSNVKTKLDLDNVVSSSVQITISDTTGYTDFSASIATTDDGQNDRLDSIELYTASVDNLYEEISSETHTLVSGSSQIQINNVTGFTLHSSSVDSRLDSLEGDSHTHSNKTQLDTINQNLSKTSNVTFNDITSSGNVIIGGDLTVLGNATEIQTSELRIEDKLITIASGSTNSAEADGSGIEIDGAGKSIIWDDATQSFILNAQVSSSVGFKGDGSELTGVSADSVAFDDITGKPDLVSGSTGEQLTASLDLRYLEINGDNVFSGSSQVNADTITNFDSNVKTKLDLDEVVSGSSQITNDSGILSSSNENFTQFSSSIDSRVDTLETTFSSSVDSRLDEIETTFSSSVDSRLDAQEVFSESLDNEFLNTNGDNVVSGSSGEQLTASLDLRYEEISSGTNTLVSGSSQVDVTQTSNIETIATTGSNTFNGDQIVSGTLSTSGVVSFQDVPWPFVGEELHILKTEPYILNLESGSRNYEYAGIALEHFEASPSYYHNSMLLYSYDNHSNPQYGTELNVGPLRNHMRVFPSNSFDGLDYDHSANISIQDLQNGTTNALIYADFIELGVFNSEFIAIGNILSSNTLTGLNTIVNSPITSSDTIEATFFYGDGSNLTNVVATELSYENITNLPIGLVSQSSQIDVTQTQNYGSIRQYDDSDNLIYLNSKDIISGSTYSSPSQGTLRATINGSDSDVDLGLQSTDTPTFNSLTASNLPEHDNTHYDALFKGTSGEFGYRTLGNAAFYMVSSSISDGNPDVLGNAGAVKDYIDEQLLIIGAGDITKVTAGDGISGGADSGEAIINLDTGSQHFTDGVSAIAPTLPDGLVSGSDQVTQSLDTRYVNVSGDTVTGDLIISGDLTVNGTTTTISTTNLNVEDNIIELNYGGSATNGGLLVKDVTGGSITSGSLLWDGTTDSWIAGTLGSENRILTTADNVITDTNIDTKIKLKLDSDNVHSGSYLGTATTSQLDEGSNLYYTNERVKTKLDIEGVVSGSVLRNLDGTGILSSSNENFTDFSSSVDSRFGALSTDYNDLQNVPSGIISSSEQISNYNTFLEINGDSVVSSSQQISDYNTFLEINGDSVISGSSQVQIDSVTGFTSFSSSVDSRIDLLELFSTSLDDNFVTEPELNTATQSLQDSIDLKLDISTYTPFSTSVDSRLDGLEGVTSENPLTFTDTSTIDFTRVGDTISADVIGGVVSGSSQVIGILDSLNTYTASNDVNQTTQNGRLTSLEVETGSIAAEQAVQDVRLGNLETYTASLDNIYEEKSSATHTLVSGSSQIDVTQTTNYSSINQYSDAKVKLKLDADGVISGSDQLTGSLVDLTSAQTISGTKTFTDIVVNGTGSFAYFISTESELNVIGQSFIVLNNDTPTQRYAGLAVYDSGSAGVTASLQFDGQTNDWFYEYSDDGGVTTDHGAVLFGPEYSTKGAPTFPTNNTIQKGNGGHHLLDSNITDDGSTITLGSNTNVTGVLSATTFAGVISGSSQIDYNSIQNQPSIPTVPTDISAFTNDVGYSTYSSNQATDTTSDVTFNTVSATGDIVAFASSDRRLKDNILPISNPLQKINSIGGYSFDWNVEKQHIYSGKDYGVIAQEIEGILPELVDTRENGYKAVKYDKLVSLLIEGIKELSQEVDELKKQINK